MSQIDSPTDKIEPCECGFKPDHYTCGYGDNPYYISCSKCRKSLHNGKGCSDDFIKLWNTIYRHVKSPYKMIMHQY